MGLYHRFTTISLTKPKFNVFGQLGYGFGFEDLTRISWRNRKQRLDHFQYRRWGKL